MKRYLLFILLTPLFLLSLLLITTKASAETNNNLLPGSSVSVTDSSNVLRSPNGTFSCGFYNISPTAFTFSIWFSKSANRTVVWTANRDRPVYGFGSKVELDKNGNLVLKDYNGDIIWSTNTSTPNSAGRAELLDSGNLVIKDQTGNSLWQSFDYPTDTLLPNQNITVNTNLISANRSLSSGYHMFYSNDIDIFSLRYVNSEISSIYWPDPNLGAWISGRIPFNGVSVGILDEYGYFSASDGLVFNASDFGTRVWRRLTLDPDGNLRLYSLNESDGSWSVSWLALPELCDVHGFCGKYGICMYSPVPSCTCPPGYEMIDRSNWGEGCKPKFDTSCHGNSSQQVDFVRLVGSDYWGSVIKMYESISLESCKEMCRRDCSCKAVEFKPGAGTCFTKFSLFNGKSYQAYWGDIYLKLPQSVKNSESFVSHVSHPICNATEQEVMLNFHNSISNGRSRTNWVYFYVFLSVLFVVEAIFIAFGCFFILRNGPEPLKMEEGYKMISAQFRRYTYKELEKATSKFKYVIGRGGSGVVYKGILNDQRVVAVKKLEDVTQGGEEFQAELSVIGQIYHINLVRVWGFCVQGLHRILVSEYVENGSLDKFLFGKESGDLLLGWKQRFQIAVGVAKGLAYLHHECLEWIVHCDVKPENILLDSDFEPKITDFGLSKLLHRGGGGSNLSRIRGTRGYIAPEWASNLPITAKVDVYSYGVLLLELVKGVRISDLVIDSENEVEIGLVSVVKMLKGKIENNESSWIEDFVDSRLNRDFNYAQAAVMVELAVSCLEEERNKRPKMSYVVEMLCSLD